MPAPCAARRRQRRQPRPAAPAHDARFSEVQRAPARRAGHRQEQVTESEGRRNHAADQPRSRTASHIRSRSGANAEPPLERAGTLPDQHAKSARRRGGRGRAPRAPSAVSPRRYTTSNTAAPGASASSGMDSVSSCIPTGVALTTSGTPATASRTERATVAMRYRIGPPTRARAKSVRLYSRTRQASHRSIAASIRCRGPARADHADLGVVRQRAEQVRARRRRIHPTSVLSPTRRAMLGPEGVDGSGALGHRQQPVAVLGHAAPCAGSSRCRRLTGRPARSARGPATRAQTSSVS